MNLRLRQIGTALALLLLPASAMFADSAATNYPVSPGVTVQKGPGEVGTSTSGTQYAVSGGICVQKGPGEAGTSSSGSQYAASAGVCVQKGPGDSSSASAEYVYSPGLCVQKLAAGSTGIDNSFYVYSHGLSVQRVPVGGSTLTTTITAGPAEGATVCGNSPQFSFAASSTDSSASFTFVYRVDGGQWQGPVSGPSVTLAPLPDGLHFFEVAAIDELGNEDPSPAGRHFTVDTLAPVISNLLSASPTITGATIQWTTDKPATSLVEYRVTGTTPWTKTSLNSTLVTAHTVTLSGLTPATIYDFRAHSSDSCGNEAISAVQTVATINDTPPTTTITSGPASGAIVCGSAATFTFTGSDAYTPVASLLYKYRLDGGVWSAPAPSTTATLTALADGSHTFEVAAVNQGGVADTNPAKRTFVIDTVAPVISALKAGSLTLTGAGLTWNTDKPATTQGEYRVLGTTAWTLTTLDSTLVTAHAVSLSGLLPGKTYDFRAHSTDTCGNPTVSPILNFATVADTTPPTTAITGGPAEAGFSCGLPVTFTFSGTDNYSQTANLRYEYQLDGGAWSAPSLSTTAVFATLTDGAHTFAVAAVDEAGNVDPNPATRHFTVDTQAPVISSLSASSVTVSGATLTWITDKTATSQVDYRIQGTTAWTSTSLVSTLVTAHSVVLSGLAVNTVYEYRVHSADGCGHETISAIKTLSTLADTTAPTTSLTGGPADGSTSCTATVTFTYTGSDNITPVSALRYEASLDGAAFSALSSSTTTTLANPTEGAHTFTVKAVDQSGNVDSTGVTVHFTVAAVAPIITAVTAIPRDVRATVTWTTDKAASSQVEYGLTTAYGSLTPLDANAVTAHSETVPGLTPLMTYHYRVHSKDACHESISADRTFMTSALLVPNLSVTNLTFPNPITAQSPATFSWTVMDTGPGDASGTWTDSVYLSPTSTLNTTTATLLGAYPAPTTLQVGQEYTQSQSVTLPNVALGNYYIILVTNSGQTLTETTMADNALAMPIALLRNQTLIVAPDQIPLTLTVNAPQSGTLNLSNLSSAPITGITATVTGATSNIHVQVTAPSSLAAQTSGTAQITVTATDSSVLSDTAIVQIADQQGDIAKATLNLSVVPNQPNLIASPSPISQGMTRGMTTLAEVTLTNTGAATATSLVAAIPNAPWLALAAPAALGSLAPGASVQIVLRLSPDAALPLGLYNGSLVINGSNASLAVPFAFNCISNATSALKVVALDEFSFFGATHPNLAGAHVVVTDVVTNAVAVNSVTGSDGTLSVASVPEGNYRVDVTADGHSPYHGTLALVAGKTNEIDPFLSGEFVTYTFTVVPIDVQDDYVVSVTPVFSTNVPAPVITLSPKYIDLSKLTYVNGQATVDFTVTNHGLIAADDASLTFPTRSDYQLTPAVGALGQVPAMTTVHVPVTVTDLSVAASSTAIHAHSKVANDEPANPCTFQGLFLFQYFCGLPVHKNDSVDVTTGLCGALTRIPPATPPVVPNQPSPTIPPNNNNNNNYNNNNGPGNSYTPSSSPTNGPENLYPQLGGPPITVTLPSFCDPCTAARLDALVNAYISLTPAQDCIEGYNGVFETSDLPAAAKQPPTKYIQTLGKVVSSGSAAVKCVVAIGAAPVTGGLTLVLPDPTNLDPKHLITAAENILHACDGLPPSSSAFNNLLTEIDNHVYRYEKYIDAAANGYGAGKWVYNKTHSPEDLAKFRNLIDKFNGFINRAAVTPGLKSSFHQKAQTLSPADDPTLSALKISDAERQELLALPLPSRLTSDDVNTLVDRWNRTVDYAGVGILNVGDVPSGQSTDFIALDTLTTDYAAAAAAIQADSAEGITDPAVGLSQAEGALEQAILAPQSAGVCAEVKLQLDQNVAITRTAFKATLQLNDSAQGGPLSGIKVSLKIIDQAGNDQTSLFVISSPTASGFSNVNGTGTLATGGNGTATWTILPTRQAAASGTTQYFVTGEIDYSQGGTALTIPLLPASITVKPDPFLKFHYFLQRNVYSDDPFTTQVEPAEPFSLGLLVDNAGQGAARNLTITSSQPKIIDNQKGLDVAFQIIGTQVNTTPVTPSLTVNLGDIVPGGTEVADFLLTASLSGQFIADSASFKHVDDLGNEQTSLIDSVDTHSLEHVVRVVDPADDGKPDFLADDIPDVNNLPDTLWNSNGTTSPVTALTNAALDGPVTNTNLTVHLIVSAPPSGFVYIRADDPGQNLYQLTSVVRSDGKVIALGDDAWITHRIIHLQGQAPTPQNRVYLFDDNTTGAYTLTYAPLTLIKPTVTLTSPHNGDTFSPNTTIVVTATASTVQAIVKELDFYADGALITASLAAPFTTSYKPAIGSHTLKAVAIDANGTASDPAQITITVNTLTNKPPVIQLTGPQTAGSLTAPATVTLSATASDPDGSIAKVDFYSNGSFLGSSIVPPYAATLQNLAPGAYTFTAIATDNQGATTTSSSLSLEVQPPLTNTGLPILRAVSAVRQANPGQLLVTLQNMGGMDAINVALAATRIKWGGQSPISITPSSVSLLTPNSTVTFMLQFPSSTTGPSLNLFATYSGRSFNQFLPVTP